MKLKSGTMNHQTM